MALPIAVTVLLCDAAQADPSGKVHMLGAGWSRTASPTGPQAIVAMMKFPWDLANQPHSISIRLLDADGHPVHGLDGSAIEVSSEVEVGRPAGLAHGSDLDASFVLNVASLPLPPGRYEWRVDVGAETAATSFTVVRSG